MKSKLFTEIRYHCPNTDTCCHLTSDTRKNKSTPGQFVKKKFVKKKTFFLTFNSRYKTIKTTQ